MTLPAANVALLLMMMRSACVAMSARSTAPAGLLIVMVMPVLHL
jgi:hypothetical protein